MTANQRRYQDLKSQGRCVKCAAMLEEGRKSVVCHACQDRDSANWRSRASARYARLKSEGRCVQCAELLSSKVSKGVRCLDCYRISCTPFNQATGRRKAKSEKWAADLANVIASAQTRNAMEQAADLGLPIARIYALRAAARRRGHEIPNLGSPTKYKGESSKWARLDALMSNPCKRCGLRGEHRCLEVSALDRRPLTMPEGCRW